MPTRYRAIFFDAGDTLIYLHPSLEVLIARGVRPWADGVISRDAIRAALPEANRRRDARIRAAHQSEQSLDKESPEFWRWYYAQILEGLGFSGDVEGCTQALHQNIQSGRAFRAFSDSLMTLRRLRALGLTVGLVSNTTEIIHDVLARLGLAAFLNPLVASYAVGYEKPDPRIFDAALAAARVRPSLALYVGDNPVVDEPAARGAGVDFMLIDRKNRYPNYPGQRITRLAQVEPLIVDPLDVAHGLYRPTAGY